MATVLFMRMIIEMTDAHKDQDHIPMLVRSIPQTPDRTGFLRGEISRSPLPYILDAAKTLEKEGVFEIAIPCMTAHYFYDELKKQIEIPILNGVAEAVEYASDMGAKTIGVLATLGAIKTGVYEKEAGRCGAECIYPDEESCKMVSDVIYDKVKSGKTSGIETLCRVGTNLLEKGADKVILGCTELSVVADGYDMGKYYLDAMEILAYKCVRDAGKLRKDYKAP